MSDKNAIYERIEARIHEAIHDRLESCMGFKRLEWRDWPGTKALSGVAADAVFQMLDRLDMLSRSNQTPPDRSPSVSIPPPPKPSPVEMLCEERISPTREDRAYQVLCALLSSPQNGSQEVFVKSCWRYVELMEERGSAQ